jgi:glucosyl-dolichyl phosphate glucuronosyltransferase
LKIKTKIICGHSNSQIADYAKAHGYHLDLVQDPSLDPQTHIQGSLQSYDRLLFVQNNVKWTGEEKLEDIIDLDSKCFALCMWDLSVVYFDLNHPDADSICREIWQNKCDFWTATKNCSSNSFLTPCKNEKLKLLKLHTRYDFKHYNSVDNWSLFNFNGKNTTWDGTKAGFRISPQITKVTRKIAISAIILPRLELPFLDEWMCYHRRLGVEKIVIYNNGFLSNDSQYNDSIKLSDEEKLYKWSKKPNHDYILDKDDRQVTEELYALRKKHGSWVEIREWIYGINHDFEYPMSQMEMVRDALRDKRYHWLFIDPDEFLSIKKHKTIHDWMNDRYFGFSQGCIRINTKIYEERKTGKRVSTMDGWYMEDSMTKCLFNGSLNFSQSSIHKLTPSRSSGGIMEASRGDIEIKHFCGSPMSHNDINRRSMYEAAGSPKIKRLKKTEDIGVYVINLEDKRHLYKKFSKIPFCHRIDAVDARGDPDVCLSYNLTLSPSSIASQLYFAQGAGAVGCYLSHMKAWEEISNSRFEYGLILEDDVNPEDVLAFLENVPTFRADVTNLGMRGEPTIECFTKNNHGLEAYVLSKHGADQLTEITYNTARLQGFTREYGNGGQREYEIFKNESPQNWSKENSILCAVDKFVGYCCNPAMPSALSLELTPCIKLIDAEASDSAISAKNPWWEMTEEQINFLYGSLTPSFSIEYPLFTNIFTSCICTYDNYDILRLTIESLLEQKTKVKIIVQDNTPPEKINGRDDWLRRTSAKHEFIHFDQRVADGLSGSRNICIDLCDTEYLHYLDDDVICPEDFAYQLSSVLQGNPDVGIVGGKVAPDWRFAERPSWLHEDLFGYLSMIDFGDTQRDFDPNGEVCWLVGANITFRLDLLKKYGGFDVSLGRKGGTSSLLGSEENELVWKIQKKHDVIYSPEPMIFHLVDPRRLSKEWFIKRATWQSVSDILTNSHWISNLSASKLDEGIAMIQADPRTPEEFLKKTKSMQYVAYRLLMGEV